MSREFPVSLSLSRSRSSLSLYPNATRGAGAATCVSGVVSTPLTCAWVVYYGAARLSIGHAGSDSYLGSFVSPIRTIDSSKDSHRPRGCPEHDSIGLASTLVDDTLSNANDSPGRRFFVYEEPRSFRAELRHALGAQPAVRRRQLHPLHPRPAKTALPLFPHDLSPKGRIIDPHQNYVVTALYSSPTGGKPIFTMLIVLSLPKSAQYLPS